MELHQFDDASEIGYGTVIDEDGQIECSFIMEKGRIAPSPFLPCRDGNFRQQS